MADRRTKKTAKQIFGYARLNFHMGMRQGKNLAVLLCMGCFLLYYLGGIRGYLASAEETVSVQELFLAMMNTHYTAMTVWVGYLLVICDIPYSEKGIYISYSHISKKLVTWSDFISVLGNNFLFFLCGTSACSSNCSSYFISYLVDKCFCQNAECTMEMWNKELFFFYVFANKA